VSVKIKSQGVRPRNVNWVQCRADFVYGIPGNGGAKYFPTRRELAEKYGVAETTVAATAQKGNKQVPGHWHAAREENQRKLAAALEKARPASHADKIVEMEVRHLDKWNRVEHAVCMQLFVTEKAPDPIDPEKEIEFLPAYAAFKPDLKPEAVKALVDVLKTATSMQRVIIGVPETRIEIQQDAQSELLKSLSRNDLKELGRAYAVALTVERERRSLVVLEGGHGSNGSQDAAGEE
jgi:hypothetical protein